MTSSLDLRILFSVNDPGDFPHMRRSCNVILKGTFNSSNTTLCFHHCFSFILMITIKRKLHQFFFFLLFLDILSFLQRTWFHCRAPKNYSILAALSSPLSTTVRDVDWPQICWRTTQKFSLRLIFLSTPPLSPIRVIALVDWPCCHQPKRAEMEGAVTGLTG